MSEYIVCVDDLEESYYKCTDIMPETVFGHRLCEQIVRCRDCRYANEVYWPANSDIPSDYLDCNGELVETWDYYNDEPNHNPVRPDGFCAWAERKENGE